MFEIMKDELNILRSFTQRTDDVVFNSCIEGNIGKVWVNNNKNPQTAVIIAADFIFLIGKIRNKADECFIKELLAVNTDKIIDVDHRDWLDFLNHHFSINPIKRYAMKTDTHAFHEENLKDYIKSIDPTFQISRIDHKLYNKILTIPFMADLCSYYQSYDDFEKNGIGYVITYQDDIVSGASSYTYCDGFITITIGTFNDYRKNGLALASASKLILECLEKNIFPDWDAANLESVKLAEKLGYIFDTEYKQYMITNKN
jgi:hypothetical protein